MGTHYRGTPEQIRALDAFIKLKRAAESLSSRLASRLSDAGLTESQFGTLEALFHLGPLCQRELGSKLLSSRGNITMVVDNLEKRGLVRRERDEADRRYVTVHLTDPGRELISAIFPDHVEAIRSEMGVLNDEELETVGRLCRRLGRRG